VNIFFDVDATIMGGFDGSLRPGVVELFERLREEGHIIYIWSGVGLRWDDIDRHGLRPLIETCFHKPRHDHHAQMVALGVTVQPDFVIDDHTEVVQAFGGITCYPFYYYDNRDREMERVYAAIVAWQAKKGRAPLASQPPLPRGGGEAEGPRGRPPLAGEGELTPTDS
jgi:hypothetical protein